ncbi:metallophosphoesterase [uncultured Acetatifactor sp.]|uniref:metallophosphoesterase n=1 Tax=uncultured Acetatifactor sp. TaxID=1671927 RepID=UPI00260207BE|nr:metallophosphoesterase [uncultured Acetatifactor sp.]MCI9573419.1 metallophosphoesterase [Lachnospiraceae bacterium]
MKVLIVSDTHRKNDNYFKALELVKPDLVIHCGDAEGAEYVLTNAAACPVQIVLGNNDFFSYLPRELELELGSFRVWVTHGHNYYVSMGSEVIKREARARGFDIVMYGHTHKPSVDRQGGIIAVNPGSLSYPRQEGRRPSYVVMEVEGERADFAIEYL